MVFVKYKYKGCWVSHFGICEIAGRSVAKPWFKAPSTTCPRADIYCNWKTIVKYWKANIMLMGRKDRICERVSSEWTRVVNKGSKGLGTLLSTKSPRDRNPLSSALSICLSTIKGAARLSRPGNSSEIPPSHHNLLTDNRRQCSAMQWLKL